MDEASQLIEKEIVDLNTIVQDIIAEVALRPADKRMRITCNFNRELPILGNANLLTSVFRNLTENAIAYSGGRDIFINLVGETPQEYTFTFADNGIGIDDQHLSHIFERFYRVDQRPLPQARRHRPRALHRQECHSLPRRQYRSPQPLRRRARIYLHPQKRRHAAGIVGDTAQHKTHTITTKKRFKTSV